MKKFRIVALLLVLVLATSCFAAGTFAKYTSSASKADTAVVASWSFDVKDNTSNADIVTGNAVFDLFTESRVFDTVISGSKYNNNDAEKDDDDKVIIAPGTWGYVDITLTNNSEVDARYGVWFTETATYSDSTDFSAKLPIKYAIDNGSTAIGSVDIATLTWYDSISGINQDAELAETDPAKFKILDFSNGAAGGTDEVTYRVYWKWDFESADPQNSYDTELGRAAAVGSVPTVTITATFKAEQVD